MPPYGTVLIGPVVPAACEIERTYRLPVPAKTSRPQPETGFPIADARTFLVMTCGRSSALLEVSALRLWSSYTEQCSADGCAGLFVLKRRYTSAAVKRSSRTSEHTQESTLLRASTAAQRCEGRISGVSTTPDEPYNDRQSSAQCKHVSRS